MAILRYKKSHNFIDLKKSSLDIRISENVLSLSNHILSIPLYLTAQLDRLAMQCLKKL